MAQLPDSAYVCANGLLDTGSLSLIKRQTSRSWSRKMVDPEGIEPNRQPPYILRQRIYSPP